MRVKVAGFAFAVCICAMVVGSVMFASSIPRDACTGAVFDTSICESARLHQSLFASILVGSSLVAASVIVGALIVSRGYGRRPDVVSGEDHG